MALLGAEDGPNLVNGEGALLWSCVDAGGHPAIDALGGHESTLSLPLGKHSTYRDCRMQESTVADNVPV